jgi:3-phosphoshikimate 1-carboxyvinyltransferase
MGRVIEPLTRMGARFMARAGGKYPPVAVQGGGLRGMEYRLPVASAQLKSALLLAGLFAEGQTTVISPEPSRDHTERMLPAYGADLKVDGDRATVSGGARLKARDLTVPNDFSSAAFFMVASTLVEGSALVIRNVGLNPTRTGLLDVLGRMGARIEILDRREVSGEPVGDLRVSAARLMSTEIGGSEVANIIDEFPVISVAAALADGVTRIWGAGELRVKESDRIATVAEGLRRMGVNVVEHEDGMDVHGTAGALLAGAEVESHGDHRIAMAFSVAALVADGQTTVRGAEAVGISFPGFYEMLKRVSG